MPSKHTSKALAHDAQPRSDTDGTPQEVKSTSDAAKSHGASTPKKRKAPTDVKKPSVKAPRRSSRSGPAKSIDPVKLINFLLSEDSLSLCRPKNETLDIEARGEGLRTYSNSTFSPFEELACALILSRPIG